MGNLPASSDFRFALNNIELGVWEYMEGPLVAEIFSAKSRSVDVVRDKIADSYWVLFTSYSTAVIVARRTEANKVSIFSATPVGSVAVSATGKQWTWVLDELKNYMPSAMAAMCMAELTGLTELGQTLERAKGWDQMKGHTP